MNLSKLALITLLLTTLVGLSACQEKGPAEKAGDKIEDKTD